MSLRAAVIGTGRIGALHAAIYARDPRTELVGVIDADVERAKRVAADLGTVAYASTEELLDGASPEVVSVAVPEGVRLRSEERRVGKECGARWSAWRCKEKE